MMNPSPITGQTKTICLLGSPVGHSISPQIHNRAFSALGLPYVYIPLCVAPKDLHNAIYTIRSSPSMIGANVTIPHKEAAMRYCDEISTLSTITGTVNTLYIRDGRLCGTTTDPIGFYRALEAAGHQLNGNDDVVILGSGGTAKTIGAALLLDGKCTSLTIAARSVDRGMALVSSLKKIGLASSSLASSSPSPSSPKNTETTVGLGYCKLGSTDTDSIDTFKRCSLIINCTSVGMFPSVDDTPIDKKFFHSGMTAFDAIYNPGVTRFLREAAEAGCKVKNGLLMLLYQGLESFKYWTGEDVPEGIFDEGWLRGLTGR